MGCNLAVSVSRQSMLAAWVRPGGLLSVYVSPIVALFAFTPLSPPVGLGQYIW